MPASAAGLPGHTRWTNSGISSLTATLGSVISNPSQLLRAPGKRTSVSTSRTRSTGMAKPMFSAWLFIAVLIPISSPRMLSSGPPELPKLIEASV